MNRLMMVVLMVFGIFYVSFASSLGKAEMLYKYNLNQDAKKELIDIIFENNSDEVYSQAYYLLGNIAFEENNISTAIDAWTMLITKYPLTTQAGMVKERIEELAQIAGESSKEKIENSIAASYIRHGDFWSKGKDEIFSIDSSWIPSVESAIKWYDKVITEYPKSTAANIAYIKKMRTILGWEESGRYGESFGIKKSFPQYITLLIDTFNNYEKEFPNNHSLQAFRFQIAQAYWRNRNWVKTREWLNIVINESGTADNFYKDLAERRLKKVEY